MATGRTGSRTSSSAASSAVHGVDGRVEDLLYEPVVDRLAGERPARALPVDDLEEVSHSQGPLAEAAERVDVHDPQRRVERPRVPHRRAGAAAEPLLDEFGHRS